MARPHQVTMSHALIMFLWRGTNLPKVVLVPSGHNTRYDSNHCAPSVLSGQYILAIMSASRLNRVSTAFGLSWAPHIHGCGHVDQASLAGRRRSGVVTMSRHPSGSKLDFLVLATQEVISYSGSFLPRAHGEPPTGCIMPAETTRRPAMAVAAGPTDALLAPLFRLPRAGAFEFFDG